MPDFPVEGRLNSHVISTFSSESLGLQLRAIAAVADASEVWPAANLAIYIPFSVYDTITVVKMSILNGVAVSGNVDVGIYDAGGAKLVSKGSTAQAGTAAIQIFDITDTVLQQGQYFLALAFDNGTGTIENVPVVAIDAQVMGIMQEASAFPLPAQATFAAFAQITLPQINAHLQGTI